MSSPQAKIQNRQAPSRLLKVTPFPERSPTYFKTSHKWNNTSTILGGTSIARDENPARVWLVVVTFRC